MAEEHGFQEAYGLCANNCGFFGSPATMNLCSKCFKAFSMKEAQTFSTKSVVQESYSSFSFPPSTPTLSEPLSGTDALPSSLNPPADVLLSAPPQQNRCMCCRKRVGLTGFRCRCGSTFCGSHRYPEQHKCSFDFKVAGKEAISRDNPVVKANKLEKI